MNKTILVVGGTGFLGTRVVRRLAQAGQSVVCLDLKPDRHKFQDLDVEVIEGDIRHIEELIAVMNEYKIDCVAALAYLMVGESEENPHLATRVNIVGINNIFEAARLSKIDRVVFTSSHAIYGSQTQYGNRMLAEDNVGRPGLVYGAMKQFNEFIAQKYSSAYGMDIRILRPSNVMGHGRKAAMAWGSRIVSEPAMGRAVHINYKSSSRVCPVYVDDVVEFIIALCLRDKIGHQVYNASGHITTLGELANTIREYIPDAQISFNEDGRIYEEMQACNIDNNRAATELDWQPRGVREIVFSHINEARTEAGLTPITR